jgi:hypothetical protein
VAVVGAAADTVDSVINISSVAMMSATEYLRRDRRNCNAPVVRVALTERWNPENIGIPPWSKKCLGRNYVEITTATDH